MSNNSMRPRLVGRDRLAARLRELRSQGGRSVDAFGKTVGMAKSKVSRIENGRQMPTVEELDAWAVASGLDKQETAELHQLRDEALTERSINRRRFADGQAAIQAEFNDLSASAKVIRSFQDSIIPSLLQTPDYARAVLSKVPRLVKTKNDLDEAVAARMKRGELLKDQDRRFEFLVWEPALYRRHGGPATMRGQLFHLGTVIGVPNIRFGVIPTASEAAVPGVLSAVILYDDYAVAEHVVDDPRYAGRDAETLHKYIDLLWTEAVEGDEARRLILAASEALPGT